MDGPVGRLKTPLIHEDFKGLAAYLDSGESMRAVIATAAVWIASRFAGQGLATAAVRAISDYAFTELKLHRIEASCVPHNAASRRVLEKAGFELEGRARAYLKINGAWADHLLFARVNDGTGRAG